MEKIIIIGAGPAGIAASLYAVRAGMTPLVLYKDEGSLKKAHLIDNYYGSPSVSGAELHEEGIEQARALGVPVKKAEVMSIDWNGDFTVTTDNGAFEAEAVVLASGASRKAPAIEGLSEFEGSGVSYCVACDGFFYRNKKVLVLGNEDFAAHEAGELSYIASDVTIITNGKQNMFSKENSFPIKNEKIKRIAGADRVEYVEFTDGEKIYTDGIFIAEGTAGSTEFARRMGAEISGTNIKVDDGMRTNVPGLFAAGDCTGGLLQVSKAVYEGVVAGTSAVKYIREKDEGGK
ncbi:MAG: NAD(P)/FAD-dependent oxidoreductase [Eubacteriales bacterium]|nr:NAD(P)/FAD-dependent oxidoreductase [Eubacteriales bacterium]MDD4390415.1 NAD(P)/FAD-dependent oxidoreductase [Eubacteriales bacterium]